jgi:PAS domain S-box-containing protein
MSAETVGINGAVAVLAEDPYRAVAEHLPDAAVVLFDRDLRVRLATGTTLPDPAWCTDHYLGRTVVDLVPAEQADVLLPSCQAALAGMRQYLETPGWHGPDQYWAVDVVPLYGEGDGTVTGGVAFWRDITKRHRAEEALRQHRHQLLEAQQLARVGSWEWDLATDRVTWSAELYRILGVDPGAVLTRDMTRELIHPDDRAMRERVLAGAIEDPSPVQNEFRAVRPDGTVVWMLAHTQGVCDQSGRVVRVVGTNQDITQAKQAQQERQRLLGRLYELLDGQHQRLAADLHDGHMQSLATIALRLDQAAVRLERGDVALVSGQLRELRQQIRDELAALRHTIATLRPLVLDRRGLAAAVAELATATRDRAGVDDCEVTVDLDGPPLDPVVETALFRVAQQALANVEQHANARRLRVGLYRDGPDVALVVQDDGRGFDPAHAQAVADTHGFGLTCMRERLQAIGGRFTLRSAPGAGTRIQAQAAAQVPS